MVEIRRLKEQGLSKRAVARRLGISRDTVRTVSYTHLDVYKRQPQRSDRIKEVGLKPEPDWRIYLHPVDVLYLPGVS